MKHILITGASSGIGRELALDYADAGVTLSISGRNRVRLDAVAAEIRAKGASCDAAIIDVADINAVRAYIEERQVLPIDLLIANAGILDGRRNGQIMEDFDTASKVFDTNLTGTLACIHAALPAMQARGAGQIVIVSSLAAFAPLADAPAYAASKAALLSYGLAMREALGDTGIKVNVVTPGYVTTGMTQSHIGAHPFKISAEKAAAIIKRGIARNSAIIGFPDALYLGSRVSQILPDFLRRLGNRGLRFHVSPKTD